MASPCAEPNSMPNGSAPSSSPITPPPPAARAACAPWIWASRRHSRANRLADGHANSLRAPLRCSARPGTPVKAHRTGHGDPTGHLRAVGGALMGQSAGCEQACHLRCIHIALAIANGIHACGMPSSSHSRGTHMVRMATSHSRRAHRVIRAFKCGLQRGTGLQRRDDRREHDAGAACRLTHMTSHARSHRLQAP